MKRYFLEQNKEYMDKRNKYVNEKLDDNDTLAPEREEYEVLVDKQLDSLVLDPEIYKLIEEKDFKQLKEKRENKDRNDCKNLEAIIRII